MKGFPYDLRHLLRQHASRFVKFLAVGLPSFLVAVPLNYVLASRLGVPKPIAYAFVLLFQVSVNFLLCRRFVFGGRNRRSVGGQFVQFMSGILSLRLLDWLIYSLAVHFLQVPYILMQLINIGCFSLLKYSVSLRVLGDDIGE